MVRTIVIVQSVIYALGLLFIITQILVPAWRGRAFFPIFHKRGRELEARLAGVRDDQEYDQIRRELDRTKSKTRR